MDKKIVKKVSDLYTKNLKDYGLASNAVGWNSETSQLLRFEKLSSIIDLSEKKITINDYGCGYGGHLDYLINQLGVSVSAYNGYDISSDMLKAAEKNLSWFQGDLNLFNSSKVETSANYTFVSGTFNVIFDMPEEDYKKHLMSKIKELYLASECGFSFNLLSSFVDWKAENLYYADPSYWFNYCKSQLSERVALLHDYPLYEWTILLKKDK